MAQAAFHFPRGFLWGSGTSSHQVEGNNTNNNWWAWEQRPGRILHGHKSGLACDWWGGRWREDLDRAAESGQNAHRLSIEWSRVQPAPDRWDENALDRYREIMRGMQERNITPLVALHHFSEPLWFSEIGGWENDKATEIFVPYVQKTVDALKEYVNYWITINEPNLLAAYGYVLGHFPPGKKDLGTALKVMTNLASTHAAAYQAIHKIQSVARVSISLNYRGLQPARGWSPLDRMAHGLYNSFFNEFFPRAFTTGVLRLSGWRKNLPQAKGTLDYLGLNYYTRELVAFTPRRDQAFGRRTFPPASELSDSGDIANVPQGLFDMLRWARHFNLPIVITENGLDDAGDKLRPRYLIQHLHELWRMVNENYPVKGYFHWTLVDNFEWERGWTQRFGLWELDVETQARRKRPSADLYTEICRENGVSSDIVARYTPDLSDLLFPG